MMSELPGTFSFTMLANPWLLLGIIPIILLLAVEWVSAPGGAVTISTGETMLSLVSGSSALRRRVPPLLRALGLTLLVVALARPLHGYKPQLDRADVVDIMLCVDVSESMSQQDFVVGNHYANRLEATKIVVEDFIQNRKEGRGDRFGLDRIGLILYAGYGWTQSPLTLDYAVLEHELKNAEIVRSRGEKRGTAIGSATGLAVSRLIDSEAKSKVIILLTDGRNNRGELDPITAAHAAKDYGIRIYTVGAGNTESIRGQFGNSEPIDEDTLRRIASVTGGKYFRATNLDSLQEAYKEISSLETTEIDIGDYYAYAEGFMPFAIWGAILIFASIFGRRRFAEVIP